MDPCSWWPVRTAQWRHHLPITCAMSAAAQGCGTLARARLTSHVMPPNTAVRRLRTEQPPKAGNSDPLPIKAFFFAGLGSKDVNGDASFR